MKFYERSDCLPRVLSFKVLIKSQNKQNVSIPRSKPLQHLINRIHAYRYSDFKLFTTFAGFPATKVNGGVLFVTTLPAATIPPPAQFLHPLKQYCYSQSKHHRQFQPERYVKTYNHSAFREK